MAATGKPLVLTLKSDGNYTLAEALDIDVSSIKTDILTGFNNSVIDMQSSANCIGLSATVLRVGGSDKDMIVSAGVDIATLFGGIDTTGTTEDIQDIAGTMVAGGIKTGITVTYQDSANNVDFEVADMTIAANSGSNQNISPGDTFTITGTGATTTTMGTDKVTINSTDTTYDIQDGELSQNNFTNADHTKLDGITAAATPTNTANVTAALAVMMSFSTTAGMSFVLDQDSFGDNSATKLATQQSIKAYVDALVSQESTYGDGDKIEFGTGDGSNGDSAISYDGTDTNWHLQQLGSGALNVSGPINMKVGDLNVTGSLDVYDTQRDIALFHTNTATATVGLASTTTSSLFTASGTNTAIANTAAGDIHFLTNNAYVMTLENGGKVGIGTTNPGQAIDVVGTAADTQVSVRVDNQDGGSTSDARLILKVASTGGDAYVRMFENGGNSWCMGAYTQGSPGTNFRITDHTNLDSNVAIEIDASQDIWMPKSLAVGQSAKAEDYAVLECNSTTEAFLPPRMTTSQRDLIGGGLDPPATGSVIYNTSTNVLNFYNGSTWGAV